MANSNNPVHKPVDVVVLTDHRYVNPKEKNDYIQNVLDEDELVLKALTSKGLKVLRKSWDDSDFDWNCAKVLLFRTTWDYFERFSEFAPWLHKVSQQCTLVNPREVLYWNIDKHYLKDLRAKGINIPPTEFIAKGEQASLLRIMENNGWKQAVVKPCISGAGRHTYKLEESNLEDIQAIVDTLLNEEAMMIQEFQKHIVDQGEASIVVIGGRYTHAVLKKAKEGEFRVQDDFGGSVHAYTPTAEEVDFARSCVQASGHDLTYARVDIFRDNRGQLCLAELELIEPELWFRMNKNAADVLAETLFQKYFSAS